MSLLLYSNQSGNPLVATLTYNVVNNYAQSNGITRTVNGASNYFLMTWQDVLNMAMSLTNNSSIQIQSIENKWNSQYNTEFLLNAITSLQPATTYSLTQNNTRMTVPSGIQAKSPVTIVFTTAGQPVAPMASSTSPTPSVTVNNATVEKFSGSNTTKWIIALIVIALIIFFIWRHHNKKKAAAVIIE